jgi:hypothetical protein
MRTFCDRPKFFLACLPLLSSFLLASGCSSEGTVSGKVYYKGKLLTSGSVSLFPEDKGGNYFSEIKSDGSYSFSKVPPGPAKISVLVGMKGPPPDLFSKMGRGKEAAMKGMKKHEGAMKEESKEREAGNEVVLPEKYANPEESGLKIDVQGGKQTHDIKME